MDEEAARRELPRALLEPGAYPHACDAVELIETHMSLVFLTGEFVYKVKKPVRFDFVDFSSAEARRFFCHEELRLNRRFAPDLYLEVVTIVLDDNGHLRIGEDGLVIEYAVKMRQFESAHQADRLLDADQLNVEELYEFGRQMASQHADIPPHIGAYDAVGPIRDNFSTLAGLPSAETHRQTLQTLQDAVESTLQRYAATLAARQLDGWVRECHGDLHLSNMVRLSRGLTAFDCLEFDADLRCIDVMCDAGFLLMDCQVRGRDDLGYAFIDGYLNVGGDYEGAALLPLFADYRSMVRAKVAGLRLAQAPQDATAADKLAHHLDWCAARLRRGPGRLIITCGVSGTGKSYWAKHLVADLGAIRLRSDVLRKVQHGLNVDATSGAPIAGGIYGPGHSDRLYADLAALAAPLLEAGEVVIVDAASLKRSQRETLYQSARKLGARIDLLHLTGEPVLLRERIRQRNDAGGDPSEADAEVLAWQLEHQEEPGADEPAISLDTASLTRARLRGLLR